MTRRIALVVFDAALFKAFAVVITMALTGCSPCRYVYAYDGGASPRPYYKVRFCPDAKPVVECDSPTRLPSAGCK